MNINNISIINENIRNLTDKTKYVIVIPECQRIIDINKISQIKDYQLQAKKGPWIF